MGKTDECVHSDRQKDCCIEGDQDPCFNRFGSYQQIQGFDKGLNIKQVSVADRTHGKKKQKHIRENAHHDPGAAKWTDQQDG